MAASPADAMRLARFYGALSPSLDSVLTTLKAAGVDTGHVRASDLYSRDLDCHNLGMHEMLEVLTELAAQYGAPGAGDVVLDIGCGLGGPGRFLVDRFGCSVLGIDLVPLRIELAQALAELTGMRDRVSYRLADATRLELDDGGFSQAWMLDVGIHIREKPALFAEIGRVLRRGGLLVMHDQVGPLPRAMQPLKRAAPYFAPSLPQLVRLVEGAGMRLLTWRDTTDQVLAYFLGIRAMMTDASRAVASALGPAQLEHGAALLGAYIETLGNAGGQTGAFVAARL